MTATEIRAPLEIHWRCGTCTMTIPPHSLNVQDVAIRWKRLKTKIQAFTLDVLIPWNLFFILKKKAEKDE